MRFSTRSRSRSRPRDSPSPALNGDAPGDCFRARRSSASMPSSAARRPTTDHRPGRRRTAPRHGWTSPIARRPASSRARCESGREGNGSPRGSHRAVGGCRRRPRLARLSTASAATTRTRARPPRKLAGCPRWALSEEDADDDDERTSRLIAEDHQGVKRRGALRASAEAELDFASRRTQPSARPC